jgi:hypothetical protein
MTSYGLLYVFLLGGLLTAALIYIVARIAGK